MLTNGRKPCGPEARSFIWRVIVSLIPVNSGKLLGGGTLASPNAAPSPKTCPDGSVPDANGNCPTSTTNQLQSQPLTNGASNNNNPTSAHHHKGSSTDFGVTGGGGGESSLTAKKGKSTTPPPCPDKAPIPPDCTLKPKF